MMVCPLKKYKVGTTLRVSEELLNDSVFNLEAYIAAEFARRIGRAEENAFLVGTGTGQPLGVMAQSGGAETGATTASPTEITADALIDLMYSLRAPYRPRAAFLMHDDTVKTLRKVKDQNGQWAAARRARRPSRPSTR